MDGIEGREEVVGDLKKVFSPEEVDRKEVVNSFGMARDIGASTELP